MRAITKFMAGGIGIAALASAAPAAAQYYPGYGNPGYGYGNPYGGNVVGQVLNSVAGGGYGNSYGGYGGVNSQAAVNQCASAVQARLRGGYGGGYGGYGYNGYASPYGQAGGGRVLGISRVEPRGNGGLTVRGVANSGHYAQAYGGQSQVDLIWRCRVDYRGYVSDVHIDRAQSNYGYNNGYTPYGNAYDYSQYGYRRY